MYAIIKDSPLIFLFINLSNCHISTAPSPLDAFYHLLVQNISDFAPTVPKSARHISRYCNQLSHGPNLVLEDVDLSFLSFFIGIVMTIM